VRVEWNKKYELDEGDVAMCLCFEEFHEDTKATMHIF